MKVILAGLLFCFTALGNAQDFDILIHAGTIADGTGNPTYPGDVGVRDGKIVAMGHLGGKTATRTIDAAGLTVAPGFIDIHNHSDYTILEEPDADSMVRQGVTSMVLGEGESVAPVGGLQEPVEARWGWTTFAGYFDRIRREGVSTNVGSYVGSGQVWTYIHGSRPGPISPAELTQMCALVRRAMEEGALGLSSLLSGPPGWWIDTDTLVALCEVASEYGGIYSTHVRTEGIGVFDAVHEAIEIGQRAHLPVEIIHLKIADHNLWGQMPHLVGIIVRARGQGEDVQADVYPYHAGLNDLASIIPPWAQEGGPEAMIRRLKDSNLRPRLEDEILHGIHGSNWYNHYTATGSWDGMLLVSLSNPKYRRFEGMRLSIVIQQLKLDPIDALFDLLENNGGSVPTVYFHHSEDDMQYALKQPFISIGSDGTARETEGPLAAGHPHPRDFGTFPRILGRYVRENHLISLEEAIRKMTSANAAKIGVFDRGLLRPGLAADITVFDSVTITDHATYEQPLQYSTGVQYVIVNGQIVLDDGRLTHARPGRVLYGPGKKS
jgi:N-acyl-D-amino-acid deacylase